MYGTVFIDQFVKEQTLVNNVRQHYQQKIDDMQHSI